MSDLCKKHKFGYEPLRLIAAKCPLCLADENEQLQAEVSRLKNISANMEKCYLAEYNKHRWIPVTERLPKESGLYQAVRAINQLPTTREYCAKSLMWLSRDTVTHWKPIVLPEALAEKGDG